ncbi:MULTISPECIES: PadR family transcriptional regulator [Bacillus]|jgi:PadR family transcriptional regulator PadR|uniref:PadR family transcriptional regulator n=5 Tax=Bacillus amyloliquefaciens group TaxID=1938374 RepID=A7ZA28_BACVZ|nr:MULTISPECIES: PadR family transcriptional regulator [Bacillus]AIU75350.1 DNA-binding protein [Bacillus subtilis]MBL3615455.1 PadR family transcriptional regulator [Bacillus sp. RHFS18]COD25039.1 transcriptional regulator [Streptococcus pneumoniae]SLB03321.1 PadR family transcriptional regulator [Mycobacteroides abscessus subsp. massiliense]HDR6219390.1 PadR family transcriptional regulator [Bacillus cereus]
MLNRELVKGSTVILVLTLLNERPMYGYELVKEMEKRSGNELQMKEGTLYPSLHKLERQSYISSYWEKQTKGPDRKYYRITDEGKNILAERTKEWNLFSALMDRMLKRGGQNG